VIKTERSDKDTAESTQAYPQERSLALAIILNVLIPGAGYVYMRRYALGVIVFIVIVAIYLALGTLAGPLIWVGTNLVMAADMLVLVRKRAHERISATTRVCPQCAERIQRAAKVCRYCGMNLEKSVPE
jgi:ribosomal protein L32